MARLRREQVPCPLCGGLLEHRPSCGLLRIVAADREVEEAVRQLARARARKRRVTQAQLDAGANAALVGEVLGVSRQAVESYMAKEAARD